MRKPNYRFERAERDRAKKGQSDAPALYGGGTNLTQERPFLALQRRLGKGQSQSALPR